MTASAKTRHWLSPLTAVFFVAIATTGVLMLLHLRAPGVRLLHEIAGLLFAAAGIAHLVVNWRSLCACFRRRTAWITLAAGLLVCSALIVLDFAHGDDREMRHGRPPRWEQGRH